MHCCVSHSYQRREEVSDELQQIPMMPKFSSRICVRGLVFYQTPPTHYLRLETGEKYPTHYLQFTDTLWASGYELYDRLSSPYQRFFESLTATYAQPLFNETATKNNFSVHAGPRGAPENVGTELSTVHPVIRTNPVTGWKSVFAVGHHVQQINGLTKEESDEVLSRFVRLITENHDLQVRHRWVNENDLGTFFPSSRRTFDLSVST